MVIGLPLAVIVGAILWPQGVSAQRSEDGVRERIAEEDRQRLDDAW
ncbi:hypothetical protein [Nocardia callitridis]